MKKAVATRFETERENRAKSPGERRRALRRALAERAHSAHENEHANRKATYVLEDHEAGTTPSRKSTRKASNRIKEASALDIRAQAARSAPRARAARAKAQGVRARKH